MSSHDEEANKTKKKNLKEKIYYERAQKLTNEHNSYFIVCYSIREDEIYFHDFYTGTLVRIDSGKTITDEKYLTCLKTLRLQWRTVEEITQFSKKSYVSNRAVSYLKRPIYSKFLMNQSKGLLNNNSCYPLPCIFQSYKSIDIEVTYHLSIFNLKNKEKPIFKEFKYTQKIPFLYVVDTIIKEALRKITNYLEGKIMEKDSTRKNDINNQNDHEQQAPHLLNTGGEDLANYKSMLDILNNDKQSKDFRFVLKLQSYEEYLFGDYSICSYECTRKYVRQFEKVSLVLYKKAIYETNPAICDYPPVIFVEKNKSFTYLDLLNKFFERYPNENCVFRFLETDAEQKEQFWRNSKNRQEHWTHYMESGDCDFPLQITMMGVYNWTKINVWFNNEVYMKNEMMLYYFNEFQTEEEHNESTSRAKFWKFFGCGKNKKYEELKKITDPAEWKREKDKIKEEEKDILKENNEKKKAVALIKKSKKADIDVQKKLNFYNKEEQNQNPITKILPGAISTLTINDTLRSRINEMEARENFFVQGTEKRKYLKDKPIFVRIKIEWLYGSYLIETLRTHNYFIDKESVNMNESITFNSDKYIISHLPKETRIGFTVLFDNQTANSPYEVGSCQIPIFQENGLMNSGDVRVNIWPFFKIEPRINCCDPFWMKEPKQEKKENKNENWIRNSKISNNNNNENRNNNSDELKDDTKNECEFENSKIRDYCYIVVKFPKFAKPLAHVPKTPSSYHEFLNWKKTHNPQINTNTHNKKIEQDISFDTWYGTMIEDMDSILQGWEKPMGELEPWNNFGFANDKDKDISNKTNEKDKLIHDHNDKFVKYLENVGEIIEKDAWTEITEDERKTILICRDFISTMPNSIDVFLRSINWFNPWQAFIAHLYLKRWTKLTPEDAIGLLDCRFPDTQVREWAIKTWYNVTDDIIGWYIMQLCQCIFYENYLLSPLADFLIEKCWANQKLLGNKFFWSAKVGGEHMQFSDRLTIILAQWFMMAGPEFIKSMEFKCEKKKEYKAVSLLAKSEYAKAPSDLKVSTAEMHVRETIKRWKENVGNGFDWPIHPSYYVSDYQIEKVKAFDSKMVPIRIPLRSSDGSTWSVIFKIGDDLRQDVLILQMLKIMDKMWWENDLDLKLSIYNVCPVELKCGFVEFMDGSIWESVQIDKRNDILSTWGAWDRELLYNFLKKQSTQKEQKTLQEVFNEQWDNFIRSWAGACVATGVLGIADRHSGNVMIKENGLFFHIDFGHIFGNFKEKCNFKRERSSFLLTPDMAYVYIKSDKEETFKNYCVKAYNILRHNGKRLLNWLITMASAGMPEFSTMRDVTYFRDMLQINNNINDEQAGTYFIKLIKDSINDKYRLVDNMIHNFIHRKK